MTSMEMKMMPALAVSTGKNIQFFFPDTNIVWLDFSLENIKLNEAGTFTLNSDFTENEKKNKLG